VAIFHLSTTSVSRSTGRSAVAAAAYRTGDLLTNERDGVTHDYRQRRGVEHTETVTPDGGPADRGALWNAAEAAERRKDARTAREWVLAIPAELVPKDQRTRDLITGSPDRELVREFAQALAERYGVAVDVAIHAPDRQGDQRNHHAHLLATTRQVSRDAAGGLVLGEKATLELSDTKRRSLGLGSAADEVTAIRGLWEQMANRALEREGHRARIDARSLAAQGIDRPATVHVGPAGTAMERRGQTSRRAELARAVAAEAVAMAGQRDSLVKEAASIAREVQFVEMERPEAVKRSWGEAMADKRAEVGQQATRAYAKMKTLHTSQAGRVETHTRTAPKPPSGLLAAFQQGAYERASQVWQAAMVPLRRRLDQLSSRLGWLREYLPGGQQGERLAERRAEKAHPDLAREYRSIMESERQAQAEAQRQAVEQRRQEALERFQQKRDQERDRGRGWSR